MLRHRVARPLRLQRSTHGATRLLQLFLAVVARQFMCDRTERGRAQAHARTELRRMSTTAFAAVGRTRWEPRVALAADLLVTVVLGREDFERGFDDAATETVSLVV